MNEIIAFCVYVNKHKTLLFRYYVNFLAVPYRTEMLNTDFLLSNETSTAI